jgi:hypothetical protein
VLVCGVCCVMAGGTVVWCIVGSCVMGQVELGESTRGRASVDVRKQGLQKFFCKQHERLQGSGLANRLWA